MTVRRGLENHNWSSDQNANRTKMIRETREHERLNKSTAISQGTIQEGS
jgi:hypothetical protein